MIPVRVWLQPGGSASPHLHPQLVHLLGVSMQLNWGALRQASPRASNFLRMNAAEDLLSGNTPQAHRHERSSARAQALSRSPRRTRRERRSRPLAVVGTEDGDPGRTPPPGIGVNMGPH